MKCSKCQKKEVSRAEAEEIKCKCCKKKFRTRFTNVCYTCQMNKRCIICGGELGG